MNNERVAQKNVMVLALGMDSEVEKHVFFFFFFEWIIKLSVLRKVWLLKMEDKGYGGAPGSGIVKGEVSLTKETGSVGI